MRKSCGCCELRKILNLILSLKLKFFCLTVLSLGRFELNILKLILFKIIAQNCACKCSAYTPYNNYGYGGYGNMPMYGNMPGGK